MISDDLQDGILAGVCARYHLSGLHQRHLCTVPLGYCNVLGLLARLAREQEHDIQKLQEALKNSSVTVMGGAGGSAGGGGGGGGGRWASAYPAPGSNG